MKNEFEEKRKKLLERPKEEDTNILLENLVEFGDFPALMELWSLDGITASTVIFLKEDVNELKKDEIIDLVFSKIKQEKDPQTTYKEEGEYIFVNFGFKVR